MQNSEMNLSEKGLDEHAFQHIVSIDCSFADCSQLLGTGLSDQVSEISESKDSQTEDETSTTNQSRRLVSVEHEQAAKQKEERIYRIDNQACKFQPSRLLREPQIHVSVKSSPAAKAVDIDQIVQHKKAVRISKGAEVQQIVISPYDHIDADELSSSLDGVSMGDSQVDVAHFDAVNSLVASGELPALNQDIPNQGVSNQTVPTSHLPLPAEEPNDSHESPLETQNESSAPALAESPLDNTSPFEESSKSAAHLVPQELKPAWAVNSFRWPETITRLCTHHRSAFQRLVQSMHLNVNREPARIGVIHSKAGQGSTTLATCLAKVLADSKSKVLLADLDLENPDLEEVANIKLKNGWQQLLDDDQSVNEFLVRDSSSNITLMPLRRQADLAVQRTSLLKKMKVVAPDLAAHFDFSVFDIGNVRNLMVDENCHVGFLDGVVIVSDSSGSESSAVAIYEKLIAAGVPAVVIAENFRSKARTAA